MAKSYAERNRESLEKYGKTLYQRRIEAATQRGLSRSQARGHPSKKRKEQPASIVSPARGKPHALPKIKHRVIKMKNGSTVVQTRSVSEVFRRLTSGMRATGTGKHPRVYFQVFDTSTGKWLELYTGNRKVPHGITVEELLRKVEERMQSGKYTDFESALWDMFVDDYETGRYREAYGLGTIPQFPSSMTQVIMYIQQPA